MTTLIRCCSLILLKPDAVARKLVGPILCRFESAGFELVHLEVRTADKTTLDQHYQHLVHKDYYSDNDHGTFSCRSGCWFCKQSATFLYKNT